jgi:hypothetical protein
MNVMTLPILLVIISLLIALNPVTIAIFTSLLAGGYGKKASKTHIHATALAYIIVFSSIFILSGAAWLHLLSAVSLSALERLAFLNAILCIIWGTISLKDFFWYTSRTSAPKFIAHSVHKRTIKNHEPISAGVLALTSAYAVTPSIGIPFIGLLTFCALLGIFTISAPIVITLMLILPLLVIFILSLRKMRLSAVMKWRQDSKMTFRLTIGLTTVFIGWLILLVLNGTLGAVL